MNQKQNGKFVLVEAKICDKEKPDSWKDGFFDFNGVQFYLPVEFLWGTHNNLLGNCYGSVKLYGMPSRHYNYIFATEVRHAKPPRLNMLGVDYNPSPFNLNSGKLT